jgi:hypothetical protein
MSWTVVPPTNENQVVTAVFDGYLSAEEGKASASAFQVAFGGTPLAVVWDVTRMTGFDAGARGAWAKAIWPIRNQIKSLKVIGAKGHIRVAAMFLAFLIGKPYEVVTSGRPEVEAGERGWRAIEQAGPRAEPPCASTVPRIDAAPLRVYAPTRRLRPFPIPRALAILEHS